MSKNVFSSLPGVGQLLAGTKAPKVPDMPPPPPPPEPTVATELPDIADPLKKKRKEASIMRAFQGGSASTILGETGRKLGG